MVVINSFSPKRHLRRGFEPIAKKTTHVGMACIAVSAVFTALPHAQIHHNPQKDQPCNYTQNRSSVPP
jgi:hypothetical protein